jgi:hypothetical protein
MDDFCTYPVNITFALGLFLVTKIHDWNIKYKIINDKTASEQPYWSVLYCLLYCSVLYVLFTTWAAVLYIR